MILSDRSIRDEIASGRVIIEPFDESSVQPSSVDLHIDRFFRVFRNHTMPYIDVKQDQEDLTELVEIAPEDVFILHPGEFVLGSTLERVALPSDLVARLEGKSSLGRLGLLIHSSLPASEQILFLDDTGLRLRSIGEIVTKQIEGSVAAFDPVTFKVDYHPVTGWYEGPPDRIFEVRLASGRRIRLTAGHNLFGLDRNGQLAKRRVQELDAGAFVAIPRHLPEPPAATATFDFRDLIPENLLHKMVFAGPTVAEALEDDLSQGALRGAGFKHVDWYRKRGQLPGHVTRIAPFLWNRLSGSDQVRPRGARYGLPVVWEMDEDLAWLIGFYVAEGYRRARQVVFTNFDDSLLQRVESILTKLKQPVYRHHKSVTCSSSMLSYFLDWIGTGGKAGTKRIPSSAFGWPRPLLECLLQGMIDGDRTHNGSDRRCYWSSSSDLVSDVLCLAPRLDIRATASVGSRSRHGLYQVSMPRNEHDLLTAVPLTDRLLVAARERGGWGQIEAAHLAGYKNGTDLSDLENPSGRDAVRISTLRRIVHAYEPTIGDTDEMHRLSRLVEGHIAWDRVQSVVDTGSIEPIFDLEVRPDGRKIENFVAGSGGMFVSNTAGFVDAGWDGHLTLELSNVANLPITLYPGMKIGQISFLQMTTEAEHPYGSRETGSKYQGQRGPTPSRYFENFRPRQT
jgi:deoxycytidine triphosphate deaminase